MIGVAVRPHERGIVQEFFELFKTPWEYYRNGERYEVLVSTLAGEFPSGAAKLSLVYQSARTAFDEKNRIPINAQSSGGTTFAYKNRRLPIYGRNITFRARDFPILREASNGDSLTFVTTAQGQSVVRLGYDLFEEVRHLLTVGQPIANAGTPTLELHIALMREMIIRSGIGFVEIPPVPDGYKFIACLTHDIDHPSLRNHKFDHTMLGFVYRATAGSCIELCRGRKTLGQVRHNLGAACKLPFVYAGMAADPWSRFDSYAGLEAGMRSTYYVITRKGYAGGGGAPAKRAAGYALADVKPQLERVIGQGNQVGLHGIDAWLDDEQARAEHDELEHAISSTDGGVRMHWLLSNENTAGILDRAGFSYDSSVGYNETVGYRAGTAQVYKPLGADKLLELPLELMDTALFFPEFLDLSEAGAKEVVWRFLDDVERWGGALTINWHDRSIAPERLWAGFYLRLLTELRNRGAWFPTAAEAVTWFRRRRLAKFGQTGWSEKGVEFSISGNAEESTPGLRLRAHLPVKGSLNVTKAKEEGNRVDVSLNGDLVSSVSISKS